MLAQYTPASKILSTLWLCIYVASYIKDCQSRDKILLAGIESNPYACIELTRQPVLL